MNDLVLLTGYPGFLGSQLLPRILAVSPNRRAICLVQAKYMELAQARAAEQELLDPSLAGRIEILSGDITLPGLGLAGTEQFRSGLTRIFHLAAVYDLSVERELAMKVNVEGTRNLLDFAERCVNLEALHYVSTCYVSGRHPGVFRETDLECGQSFNNFYEETKYLAEVEVRKRIRAGMPGTVYRPSIVVGDSETGETQKYDGPYFVIQWLLRQPKFAIMPVLGDPTAHSVNVVPRDYVVKAIASLSELPSQGMTYHLADPTPLTVDEMITQIAQASGRHVLRIPLTLGLAHFAIDHVPGVYRLMRIPSSATNYFVHPTMYSTQHARAALEPLGIHVPHLGAYIAKLVQFVRQHPEIGSSAML